MRCWLFIVIGWAALVFTSPAPVLAAKAGGESGHSADSPSPDKDHKPEPKRKGVEEGIFMGAIEVSLWTILVFLGVLFVLNRVAWGPIRDGLDKRERGIASDKHEAEKARKEAEELRAKLDRDRIAAEQAATQRVEKSKQDAAAAAAEELARGKADLQTERERMRHDLEVNRDQALQEIWAQAAQLATLISAKAVRKNLTYEDHRALLDEALNEFRAAARARQADLTSARA